MTAALSLLGTGTGLGDLLAHPFMRQALLAGLPVAALAGLVGYFMVLRSQVFSGDALSHVSYTGAMTALAFGVDLRLGLFAGTLAVAVVLGLLGSKGRANDVVIGTVFAWVLGLGVLAQSVYTNGKHAGGGGSAGVSVLFGSVFGLSLRQSVVAALVAGAGIAVVLLIARPLLFASLDEAVAGARGVPVRALGVGFLALVGLTAAEATQVVGALLLLGLLAAPAGAAQRLTDRPYVALALAGGLSVVAMGAGLVVSYLLPRVPAGFAVIAIAAGCYAATFLVRRPDPRAATPGSPRAVLPTA
jgi:zinc/manganese transport system permease protein